MPHRCGSPCLCKRGGQGWQEQLLQPGGAGVQLFTGDEQSGRGARPGGRVLATGFYPPWVTCFSLSALCSTMDSRTATSPAMESSSGQRVSAWGCVGWGAGPGARAPLGLPLSVLMPAPRGNISLKRVSFPPGSSPSCFSPCPMQVSTPELWEATSTTKTPRRRTSPRRCPPARPPARSVSPY